MKIFRNILIDHRSSDYRPAGNRAIKSQGLAAAQPEVLFLSLVHSVLWLMVYLSMHTSDTGPGSCPLPSTFMYTQANVFKYTHYVTHFMYDLCLMWTYVA